jgi:hypothetical protein
MLHCCERDRRVGNALNHTFPVWRYEFVFTAHCSDCFSAPAKRRLQMHEYSQIGFSQNRLSSPHINVDDFRTTTTRDFLSPVQYRSCVQERLISLKSKAESSMQIEKTFVNTNSIRIRSNCLLPTMDGEPRDKCGCTQKANNRYTISPNDHIVV